MKRHLLKALILCLTLPSLVFPENLAELGQTPSEEVESPTDFNAMPSEAKEPEELQEIPLLGGVVTATSCKSLTCDVPLTDTIQTPTTRDCFSFSISGGTVVQISVVETSPSGPNFNPIWRLLTGAGAPASNCGGFTLSSERDCGPLPASGNPYRVKVEDFGRNDTGTYRVRVCPL